MAFLIVVSGTTTSMAFIMPFSKLQTAVEKQGWSTFSFFQELITFHMLIAFYQKAKQKHMEDPGHAQETFLPTLCAMAKLSGKSFWTIYICHRFVGE